MEKYFSRFVVLITLFVPYLGNAQHDLNYNLFSQQQNVLNGSLSLMDPNGGAALLGSLKWIGLDGAPRAYTGNAHVGIKSLGMVAGVQFRQSSIGVIRDQEFGAYIASGVRLSEDEHLALSVGGAVLMYAGNLHQLDGTDPSYSEDIRSNQGMISLGTSYFREDRYYVGLAIPRFTFNKKNDDFSYDFARTYNVMGGILFPIDEEFHIRPSFLVTYVEDMDPSFHINTIAFFAQKFGLGIGVQNRGDLAGLLQFNLGNFGVGYSYQFNPSGSTINQRISSNTHEIGLRYRVGGMRML